MEDRFEFDWRKTVVSAKIEPPDDLTAWVDFLKHWVADYAATWDSDADGFIPVFVAVNAVGVMAVVDGRGLMRSEESKNFLAREVMPFVLRSINAVRYGWMTEAWTVAQEDNDAYDAWAEAHPDAGLGEFEGRREVVQVIAGEWTGEVYLGSIAMIREPGNPLRLGSEWVTEIRAPWGGVAPDEETAIRGRFVDTPMAFLTGAATKTEGERRKAAHALTLDPRAIRLTLEAAQKLGLPDDPEEWEDSDWERLAVGIEGDEELAEAFRALVNEHMAR